MKLTIERSVLLKSLSHVQSVVEKRNTIPILSNVLLTTKDSSLELNATDMDISMVEAVNASISQPGTATAPAHTLYDIVRKLPDGSQISIEHDSETQQLTLRSGRSRFSLPCLPADEFPNIEKGVFLSTFVLTAQTLKSLLLRTAFAMSTEETRYYLNGIYMHPARNGDIAVLRTASTDGHRLARMETALPDGAENLQGIIIPRKTVTEFLRLLDEPHNEVEISVSETQIRLSLGDIVLTSKLVDGTFPDYEAVIPSGNDRSMEVGTKLFTQAIDRVSSISSDKTRGIRLSLREGSIILTTSSSENSSATEEIEAYCEMPDMEIGFNSRYVLDILAQIEGDSVRFMFADTGSPTIVQEVTGTSALYVLMPMRV